jgi:parvulin-like peptidyl-prolyl isomerase
MSVLKITLAAMAAALALVAAGCGGGDESVADGVVAVVDGTEITKAELDEFMGYAKKGYEASKQEFPKAGTPEYQSVQSQWVAYLVQRAELRQAAEDLGIEVAEKDVAKTEKDFIAQRFGGKRAEYEKALKAQGFTVAAYRTVHESSALSAKLFEELTKDVTVSDEDVLAYYTQNQANYPESRDVRHVLIAVNEDPNCKSTPTKPTDCKVDFDASKAKADEIYEQLVGGANFAAVAKAESADPGSKDQGGKLSINRGQTVPEFDKTAFALAKDEISKPVKTQYGYHIIQPLSPVRQSFESYKDAIRTTVLQERKNAAMQAWVEDLAKDYESKVTYAEGYALPELPEAPPTTATE